MPNVTEIKKINCCRDLNNLDLTTNSLPNLLKCHFEQDYRSDEPLSPSFFIKLTKAAPDLSCRFPYFKIPDPSITEINLENQKQELIDVHNLFSVTPNLKILNLKGCKNIEIRSIYLSPNILPNLVDIDLRDSSVTAEFVKNVLSAAPNIKKILVPPHIDMKKIREELIQQKLINSRYENRNPFPFFTENQKEHNMNHNRENDNANDSSTSPVTNTPSPTSRQPLQQIKGILTSRNKNVFNQSLNSNTEYNKEEQVDADVGTIIPISKILNPIIHAREHVFHIAPNNHDENINKIEIPVEEKKLELTNIVPLMVTTSANLQNNPVFIEKMESSGKLNLYEARFTISLQSGKKYKLTSLTPQDELLNFLAYFDASSDPAPALKVFYNTADNFYYLSSDKDCVLHGLSTIGVPKNFGLENKFHNSQLNGIIEHCKSFYTPEKEEENKLSTLHNVADTASGIEKLEAIYTQQKGRCELRTAAFLHQISKLALDNIKVRGVEGAVHSWIEISEDNGNTWYSQDLGGHPAELNLTEISTNQPPINHKVKFLKNFKPETLDSIHEIFGKLTLKDNEVEYAFQDLVGHLIEHPSGLGENIITENIEPFLQKLQERMSSDEIIARINEKLKNYVFDTPLVEYKIKELCYHLYIKNPEIAEQIINDNFSRIFKKQDLTPSTVTQPEQVVPDTEAENLLISPHLQSSTSSPATSEMDMKENKTHKYNKSEADLELENTFRAPPYVAILPKPEYKSLEDFINTITKSTIQNKRVLLQVENPKILEKLRSLFILHAQKEQQNLFPLDNYADFQSSRPQVKINDLNGTEWTIQKPPTGELYQFLNDEQNSKMLLVDWSNLSASEMVRVNSVIDDKERHADSIPIPENTQIIGLISKKTTDDDKGDFLEDPSFTSRHDTIITDFPFTESDVETAISHLKLDVAKQNNKAMHNAPNTTPIVINLYESPNWKKILLGSCYVNGDKSHWQKGDFIEALETGRPLEIKNGPRQDYLFSRFMEDIANTGHIYCYGKKIQVKQYPLNITRSQGYDFDKLSTSITALTQEVNSVTVNHESYTLNSATFERCLVNELVVKGKLIRNRGWIASHAKQSLSLFITGDLNVHQWAILLQEANQHQVNLHLSLAPTVKLPKELLQKLNKDRFQNLKQETVVSSSTHSQVSYTVCNDIEFCLASRFKEKTPDTIIIDASELNDEALLYGNAYEFNDNKFKFNEKIAQVWKSLCSPTGHVIIKGKLSEDLMNHLSSLFLPNGYLWRQGHKETFLGKLNIITDKNQSYSSFIGNKEIVNTSLADKQNYLLEKLQEEQLDLETIFSDYPTHSASLFEKPYSNIIQALKFAKAYQAHFHHSLDIKTALQGSLVIPIEPEKMDDKGSLNLSYNEYQNFENKRNLFLDFTLSWSPCAFIESPSGMGKSSFIKEYANQPGKSLFMANKIQEWALHNDDTIKILFIDEANVVNTDWTKFKGLFDMPPSIYIDGKYYRLSDKHKVVFAGNPMSYGAGRQEQSFFKDHPCFLKFPPMSAAYIHHKILAPILRQQYSDENEIEILSQNIFKKYKLSLLTEPEKYGITVRDLQYDALKFCALNHFTTSIKPHQQSSASNEYLVTESRTAIKSDLEHLLRIRSFRLSVSQKSKIADAVLYGGKCALFLEGPPGVGKSDFIKIIRSKGFKEVAPGARLINPEMEYYFIPASLMPQEKLSILEDGFQKGAIVVMEEITSSTFATEFINSYLMGTDIHGKRPDKPGFTLIGASNAASLRGRKRLDVSVKSRGINHELREYTEQECIAILNNKSNHTLPEGFIQFIVSEFLKQQHAANINYHLSMPTFRDLIRKFNEHIEKVKPCLPMEFTAFQHKAVFCDSKLKFEDYKVNKQSANPKSNILNQFSLNRTPTNPNKMDKSNKPPLRF